MSDKKTSKPVDTSKEFEKSGMRLITDPRADYWLDKYSKQKKTK